MIDGIILAGGYSSRVEQNKMLLDLNGTEVICHVIETMKDFCEKIIVVTGHYHEDISRVVSKYPFVIIVKNEEYSLGMFSSVKCGVKEMKHDFFLVPGDYPVIDKSTYSTLKNSFGVIRVPVFNNRRGHPIYIEKDLIVELLNEPIDSNLKVFRDRYSVSYVQTNDSGILKDIDTMNDYHQILKENERNDFCEN